VERHVQTFAGVTPVQQQPAPPKPDVKTNVFAGSSAPPTIKAPAREVQTGGFGDPNGFKGSTDVTAKLNAPRLGGFDRPAGAGDGNGTAGTHGRPGVVASAGFGSGVATQVAEHEAPGGGIRSGGFGDARAASGEPAAVKASAPAAIVPVEIVEKPQPQYTREARDLKIQGEVHLKVLFQADGSVRVLQVVRGLGHGLDEAAEAAAQKIRFKPAQRDGRPCDMTATVHIVFQLAS
jgi:TonB family protein